MLQKNMGEKILCDVCQVEMRSELEPCVFSCGDESFHAEALRYICPNCGYQKLGSGHIQIWMDDKAPGKEKQEECPVKKKQEIVFHTKEGPKEIPEKQEKEPVPKLFSGKNEKYIISDQWLDWMLREHPRFHPVYQLCISKKRKQERYLDKYEPDYRVILNDRLYDTKQSDLFYTEIKSSGTDQVIKKFYYLTKTGLYFRIIVQMGESDDLEICDLKEIKRLLAKKPDIYMKVIPNAAAQLEFPEPKELHIENSAIPGNRKPIL